MSSTSKRKLNFNHTYFSLNRFYSVEKVAELTCHSIRTVNENWRKEGLLIEKGKIKGKDIIEFLKEKKAKRKIGDLKENEYCCVKTKKIVTIPLATSTKLLQECNRFILLQSDAKYSCQKFDCKYRNQNLNCKVRKIISTKLAMKLYKDFFIHHTFCISNDAKEKLNELMSSSTCQPSLIVKNSSLTSNTPSVDFNNKTMVEPIAKQIITQSNLRAQKNEKSIIKTYKKRGVLMKDATSLAIRDIKEEKDKKKYYAQKNKNLNTQNKRR